MMKIFALVLCVVFIACAAPQLEDNDDYFKLPAGTITCQIDSPDRDECIKEAIQDMLPKLVDGLQSLHIPPLDPFNIDSQSMSVKRGNNFAASIDFSKTKIYGLSKANITDIKTKITKKRISKISKVYIPQSMVEGYYRAEVRFNDMDIKAKGYFNVTAFDVNLVSRSDGDIIVVDGKEYLKLTKYDVSPQFGDLKIFATGLLSDPESNRIVLEFVNQYWAFLLQEMMPQVRAKVEPILIEKANEFLLHVPLRTMLYYGDEVQPKYD